ncbi:type II toxin-antitoxin system Phd/YefM family antitoxin [Erwinia psidii]|uniref:Antitoxin n=1 Tax=Erwinia psidii TaxID=69224 RepID=A0A3N6S9N7_9GAMM|nr:type II toxin-antitoxin system Phd/YefM family antitoxin [Erwinia psidii]MCX8959269.1 type II toxin-antitoxin system Phd/YefM family antitoxin [Erwinia psidii]MCX8962899.1 type II toxin-antitoxin system Phd/YefM family antitoxin [Erwinia psidii]MCX8966046.1 type II toxin-antitoxin system Phd/YefM family antitoxin [Erwinia psidii]RQM36693.1 type II toxin-antitoxin system Phd/YefM family antitoxin [Erwinia psidii]
MKITTISSRLFNQERSKAKKAAETGPVYITDRGKPAHVLLTYEQFKRITGSRRNILDVLAMPESADIAFEPERENIISREMDF